MSKGRFGVLLPSPPRTRLYLEKDDLRARTACTAFPKVLLLFRFGSCSANDSLTFAACLCHTHHTESANGDLSQ